MTNADDQSRAAFEIGDIVVIKCNDEGYTGQSGEVIAVFSSGRCQVSVGRITILNLPPEAIDREVSD